MDHRMSHSQLTPFLIGNDSMANVQECRHRKVFETSEFGKPTSTQLQVSEENVVATKLQFKNVEKFEEKGKKEYQNRVAVLAPRHVKAVNPRTTITSDQKKENLIEEMPCKELTSFDIQNLDIAQYPIEELTAEVGINLRLPQQNWNFDITNALHDVNETIIDEIEENEETSCRDLLINVPADVYQLGQTVYGTQNAVLQLAKDVKNDSLKTGRHGVFTDREYEFLSKEINTQIITVPLGQSSHGSVHLIKRDKKTFVKKRVLVGFRPAEVVCMQKLDHPNIIKMGALLMNQGVPEIIMPYAGKSLHQYTRETKPQQREIWNITTQMFKGLAYLDTKSIIHMDIKPENLFLLINEHGMYLKIGDFGSAKLPGDNAEMEGMTPEYLPPEVCRLFLRKHYPKLIGTSFEDGESSISSKCDVYQAGLVVMFMYRHRHVLVQHFQSTNQQLEMNMLRLFMMKEIAENEDLAKNLIPSEVEKSMKCLLQNMLHGNINKRFTAQRILDLLQVLSELPVHENTEHRRDENQRTPEVEVPREKAIHGRRKKTKINNPVVKPQLKEEVMDHSMTIMNEKILKEPPQVKKRMVKQVLKRRIIDRREEIPHKNIKTSTSGMDSTLSSPSSPRNMLVIGSPMVTSGISMEIPPDHLRVYAAPVQAQDDVIFSTAVQETNDQMECDGPGNIPNLDLFDL